MTTDEFNEGLVARLIKVLGAQKRAFGYTVEGSTLSCVYWDGLKGIYVTVEGDVGLKSVTYKLLAPSRETTLEEMDIEGTARKVLARIKLIQERRVEAENKAKEVQATDAELADLFKARFFAAGFEADVKVYAGRTLTVTFDEVERVLEALSK